LTFIFVAIALNPSIAGHDVGTRRALLIGCSQYSGNIAPLPGAANDARRFAAFLSKEFQFADVQILAETSGDERPTANAIRLAFDALIARTRPHDQVFILVSGHGTQIPVPKSQTDLLAKSNPEPDGFDEVFLASDYSNGANLIKDDQFGDWLDQLRTKPADVWIVFDCCFSGTMTRGKVAVDSTIRGLHPADAGISEADIQEAATKAKALFSDRNGVDSPIAVSASMTPQTGKLVAFYACQPFETAKEVYRPEDGERTEENRSGLLSYHLLRSLRRCGEEITYRDLARMIVSGIRAELGSRGPTPLFEGSIDQRVLGIDEWPVKGLYLEKAEEKWRVSGGRLSGLDDDTVLSIHPLSRSDSGDTLGYARVTEVSTTQAVVVPIAYGDVAEIVLDDYQLPLRCEVTSESTFEATPIGILPQTPSDNERLNRIVQQVQKNVPERVSIVDSGQADCLLTFVTPAQAMSQFHYTVDQPGFLLVERQTARRATLADAQRNGDELLPVSFYEEPDNNSIDAVTSQITSDLQRVRAWEMLWKVASSFGENSPSGRRSRLSLRVIDKKTSGSQNGISTVRPGDELEIHLDNYKYSPVWYTVFFMNAKYGIEFVDAGTIRARQAVGEKFASVVVERMKVNADTVGIEGYIALAVPLKDNRAEPDFRFLAQAAVGEPLSRNSRKIPDQPTLFEQVLIEATQGRASVRSGVSSDKAEVTSFSWVTVGR